MTGFVLLFALAAGCVLLAASDQRRLWYRTRGWMYRDPQANEPSAAGFALHRLVLGGLAVALLVVGFLAARDGNGGDVRDPGAADASGEPTPAGTDDGDGAGTGDGEDAGDGDPCADAAGPVTGPAVGLRGADRFARSPADLCAGRPEPSSRDDADAAPSPAPDALPATEETVRAVLPDEAAMSPSALSPRGEPEVTAGDDAAWCEVVADLCASLRAHGAAEFAPEDDTSVLEFQVLAFDDPAAAHDALTAVAAYYEGSREIRGGSVSDPAVGEEALSYADHRRVVDGQPLANWLVVRQGPFLGTVWHAAVAERIDQVGGVAEHDWWSMFDRRLRQASQGERPAAVAPEGSGRQCYEFDTCP